MISRKNREKIGKIMNKIGKIINKIGKLSHNNQYASIRVSISLRLSLYANWANRSTN